MFPILEQCGPVAYRLQLPGENALDVVWDDLSASAQAIIDKQGVAYTDIEGCTNEFSYDSNERCASNTFWKGLSPCLYIERRLGMGCHRQHLRTRQHAARRLHLRHSSRTDEMCIRDSRRCDV